MKFYQEIELDKKKRLDMFNKLTESQNTSSLEENEDHQLIFEMDINSKKGEQISEEFINDSTDESSDNGLINETSIESSSYNSLHNISEDLAKLKIQNNLSKKTMADMIKLVNKHSNLKFHEN